MDEVKIIESSNSKSFLSLPQIKTSSRTLSDPTGHCLALLEPLQNSNTFHRNPWPDNVRSSRTLSGSPRTLSGIWIWAQRLVSWESSIYTPPPPTALLPWILHFAVEQAHILHSQRSNSLSPRAFIPSSYLGIEWRKDLSSLCDSPHQAHLGYWIFILHTYYAWSLAPRWLEVALELPFVVVSHGKVCEGSLCIHKERSKS
jgi:hypothetical protein